MSDQNRETAEGVEQSQPTAKEIKQSHEDLQEAFAIFKEIDKRADEDRQKHGEELGEVKEGFAKIEARFDEIEKRQERMRKLPVPGLSDDSDTGETPGEYKSAFWGYCRKGDQNLNDAEKSSLIELQKATMTVGDDTTGGYLAPPEFVQEIIKGIVEVDPVRQLSRVRSTSQRLVQIPTRTSTSSAMWTGAELDSAQETNPTYGMEQIAVHELSAVTAVSNQDLEDSAFDLEGELRDEMISQFAKAEGTGFVSGDKVKKPEGFLVNADVEQISNGHATLLEADGLIDLFYALPEAYAQNATWLMERPSVKEVRKLKDTTDQYLWQPGLAELQPNTILGAPYRESPSMPAIGADTLAIALGDFRQGYLIVDRSSISVLRDDFTQARKGVVEFIARRRVGGQVVLAEAIKILKIEA